MEIDQVEKIRTFTDGDIIRGIRNQMRGVTFTKGSSSLEFVFGDHSSRIALRIQSDDLTLHFEFPADEIEQTETPDGLSSLIFRDSKSGERLLSLTRSEQRYLIDPIMPFLTTEGHGAPQNG